MADIKWIKICTDIFDDEKILLIESMPEKDSLIVIWFKLLCMAGRHNNSGVFVINDKIAYTDEMLSTIFRRPLNTVRLALSVFEQYGMIEIVNGTITIPNWEKHQSIDKLERIKEQNRQRAAVHRAKQRELADPQNSNVTHNVTVTLRNATDKKRKEEEKKEEINIYSDVPQAETPTRTKQKRFVPPTLEDVQAYCQERQNNVDAERFIDYYTANGRQVGKNKMKDWKAAVRTWEKNGYSNSSDQSYTPKESGNPFYDMYLESKERENGYDTN